MHAIGKRTQRSIEPATQKNPRRLFFMQLAGGILGGWAAGKIFLPKIPSTDASEHKKEMKVMLHPLAVARRTKEEFTHDK
jgi:hypothetical protein